MKRLFSFLVAITATLMFMSSTGFAKEIKVGVIWPMTGPIASFGQMAWKGAQIAKTMVPKTKDGATVKLILLDNKGDKVETANATSRLITKDHVKAIIGAIASGNTLAAAPIAEKNHIPLLSSSATNPLVTKGKEYVSRVCFIDPFQGSVAAKYAINKLHAKTAAVVVDIAQDYSVGLAKFFVESFKKMGGKIVVQTFVQTGDQDFSAQISALRAKNPEFIYMPTYYQEAALFARQARQFGLNQVIMGGDGLESDALLKVGGKAVENVTFTTHYDPKATSGKVGKEFLKKFKAKYKVDPDAMAALGGDAYLVMVDAINRAGGSSATSEAINKAIRSTKGFHGITGILTLVHGDAIKSAVVRKVKDGKFVYVATVNP
jgi:branched-chain amino acid transport system substrate-binding protein